MPIYKCQYPACLKKGCVDCNEATPITDEECAHDAAIRDHAELEQTLAQLKDTPNAVLIRGTKRQQETHCGLARRNLTTC